jgi:hypothetical protein
VIRAPHQPHVCGVPIQGIALMVHSMVQKTDVLVGDGSNAKVLPSYIYLFNLIELYREWYHPSDDRGGISWAGFPHYLLPDLPMLLVPEKEKINVFRLYEI